MTTDGEDYTGISEDLTFDQNTNRVCVTVNITNDNVREGPEIVNLTITTGDPDVIVVPGEGVIVIVDDDGMFWGSTLNTSLSIESNELLHSSSLVYSCYHWIP